MAVHLDDRDPAMSTELTSDFAARLETSLRSADSERRRHALRGRLATWIPVMLLVGPLFAWLLTSASPGGEHVAVNALVSLKSGTAKGRFKVKIRPEAPSGELLPAIEVPVLFEGEERGVNLILQIAIQAEHEGLYWFDVFLEEGRLTRIPLRVVYQPQRVGGPTSEPTD